MTPPTSLNSESTRDAMERLRAANLAFARHYPGESGGRQPVHTVYGGAHLFRSDAAAKLGALALRALEDYAPEPADLARVLGLPETLAPTVHARIVEKLRREPVEDFRTDFEDGYGNRPDAEEDGHAETVAREMAAGLAAGTLPPFIGIRIKPFTEELRERSMRTLDIVLTTLTRETGGRLPDNFVVTLPKVTIPEQVSALADLFDLLEPALGLPSGSLRLEIMIETPQSILDENGQSNLPLLADAARGRCVAAHFGTYDYTASCNITAAYQAMDHPVCDFAKHMMQVAYAGTGIWISDGATNVLPVPPHRAGKEGASLTSAQTEENRAAIHAAWRLHAKHVRHSLTGGFYQGWDLHPAQLVTRYATVFAFFLEGLDAASERLRNFVEKAARATLVGEVFDDAATGQGLLNYFLRAVNCGAITEEEALERSGLTLEELRGRSFVKILANRRG
ncbi:MAG TPA: phosphoenolpyruvate kinase [Thermoanaerobaculia bacterium]|nr:phosphoenolpyruvate kinase [Thermoanaerobaculia bacterium]